jgi:arginase
MPQPTAILGAPTAIGISPYRDGGARRLDLTPGALRELHLVERLRAHDLGDVTSDVPYRDRERPEGRVRNEDDVVAYSQALGSRIAEVSARHEFVVLLGGDCSILLGVLAGLRRARGAVGLAYIDAHADFASLEESPSRSACSMNLALAVGRGYDGPLSHLAADSALVEERHVAHLGRRDEDDTAYGSAALRRSGIADLPARAVRARSPAAAAADALARATAAPGGFWIHLDVDVLDPALMPAVDSPLPDGLSTHELLELARPLIRHPAALGLQLTIYDPTLDPDRRGARLLVDLLAALLGDREAARELRRRDTSALGR